MKQDYFMKFKMKEKVADSNLWREGKEKFCLELGINSEEKESWRKKSI